MSKRQLEITSNRYLPRSVQHAWGAAVYLCLSAGLAVLAWRIAASVSTLPLALAGLLAVHAALTVTGQRCLANIPTRRAWSYRLAFLISAGLAIPYTALAAGLPWTFSVIRLLTALAGAFLGGLVVTRLDGPLWENNSPPTPRDRAEVLARHQDRVPLGPLPRLDAKRLFDAGAALFGLFLSAPAWLLMAFLVWFEEPGPLLFVKNSVGKGGVTFHQLKFRTMVPGAESVTGPVLARERDDRVLWVGRVLRKTALDELPQLINILKGEMSFVGPRPQRTVLVHDYLERMPEYAERHRVLPGLAGLAQVAGDYYLTPRQKLRFDRLYIRHAGLGFDLKLIGLAFLITFWYRWQPGWNGRLPRKLLHKGRRKRSDRSGVEIVP
jgi:lipopolysaccharide/colanic/teichoic acid biosynthesis glycosyltransferase